MLPGGFSCFKAHPVQSFPLISGISGLIFVPLLFVMSIEEINRKHYFKTDMYYRVGYGLSSRLLAFRNGIIYLQVVIGRKWEKDYHATTLELAHCWKTEHEELKEALGCKVFIVDAQKYPYKQDLLNLKIHVSYDTRMGMLFTSNVLN